MRGCKKLAKVNVKLTVLNQMLHMHVKEINWSSTSIYFCKFILKDLFVLTNLPLLLFSQLVGMVTSSVVKLGLEVDRVIRPRHLLHELLELLLLAFHLHALIKEAREALERVRVRVRCRARCGSTVIALFLRLHLLLFDTFTFGCKGFQGRIPKSDTTPLIANS